MSFVRLLAALALLLSFTPALAQPIDRQALVSRHNPTLRSIDPHAPLMLGNGDFAFTADITGLQTFPEAYSPLAPLLSMAQWAWHSFPNPQGYTEADGLVPTPTPRGEVPYAWMRDWSEAQKRPALTWLRENPHRFSLGRVSIVLTRRDGRPATVADIEAPTQTLDMWRGVLVSRFRFDGEAVEVETRVHPDQDAVVAHVRSPLVSAGRLKVLVRFPGVAKTFNPDPSDWTRPELHVTEVVSRSADSLLLRRKLDDTVYYARLTAPAAEVRSGAPHAFEVRARSGNRLTVAVAYGRDATALTPLDLVGAPVAVAAAWRSYWSKGGAVDFSGSTDPRAAELERRVVLSQYLQRVNASGEIPPQEEGLFSNSWNGKFHLEMHPWHSGHFATWGRPELLERSLGWYLEHLPKARAEAASRKVEGAWWPKMSGPEGRNSPSTINPFIMWQQPHPIFLAELDWRARRDPAALERYAPLVEETARLLASWPVREAGGRYVLGPPIIPVQENHPALTTVNPAFEVAYFRWALQTAQAWRERRGLPREAAWDRVIAGLGALPQRDGLYLPVESAPDFWRQAASARCRRHAVEDCQNRDHPSFLMAYGFIGGDRVDPETMRRTLRAVEDHWDVRQTWGWDFPMVAMTAARLGEPETALAWLFRDLPNNRWGVSGMTPRVHLDEHAQAFLPDAPAGTDGPGYRRAAETYFPSNGSLLMAVAMMAAGWDGSQGEAPGFPKSGWVVRHEGILPLP